MTPKYHKTRDPRVEISPQLYRALCAEAILQNSNPKDLVAKLIKDNLSPKTRSFLDTNDTKVSSPQEPNTTITQELEAEAEDLVAK